MIIGRDLMIQIGLLNNFRREVIKRDGVTLSVKELICLPGQTYITSSEMRKMLIQIVEQVPAKEATEILVKLSTVPMRRQNLNM